MLIAACTSIWCCKPRYGQDRIVTDVDITSSQVAEGYLRSAIESNPDVIENYIVLSRIFIDRGKSIQALRTLENAYSRNPKHPEVIYLLSQRYLHEDDFAEARAVLNRAENNGIHSFGIYKNLARLYFATGDFELMQRYVNQVLQYDENDWEMLYYKGIIAREQQNAGLAFSLFEKAYALHPSDSIYNSMYDYAVRLDDMQRVERYIDPDFVIHDVSSDLYIRVGSHFRSKGMRDTTMVLYRRAIEMDPSNWRAYLNLGEVYLHTGQLDSALFLAQMVLDVHSESTAARLLSARAYDRLYRYTSAREEYERLLRQDPDHEIARKELDRLNGKVAYLRDMKRIEEQKMNPRIIKVPKAKKLKR